MTLDELKQKVRYAYESVGDDYETSHAEVDRLLLEFISDAELETIVRAHTRWYS